jgi:amino acid permease
MNRVIVTSIGTAMGLYLLVAFTGYLSFGISLPNLIKLGSNVTGNIIAMYANSAAATFGRAAIVVLMLFSYPLQAHPCRTSLDKIFSWKRTDKGPSQIHDSRFALITALILTTSYIVAMTVSSLDRVLAFVGSTGSTAISFILPGVFYHRMTRAGGLLPRAPEDGKDEDEDDEEESQNENDSEELELINKGRARRKRIRRNSALALIVYGLVVMAVCLTVNVMVGSGH